MPFLHSFEPGGVERVALRLCGTWANDPGLDVRLVMGREDGAMLGEAPLGLRRHVTGSGGIPTAAWETPWMMLVLFREIRRQQPDILFAAGNSYSVVAVVMKLLLGQKCPPVVLKVSNDLERADLPAPARGVYRLWLRIQGKMIDRFVGLAEPMRAEIVEAMRVDPARVDIIDDPALGEREITVLATIGAARPTRLEPGRRYIAVGRLAAQKNFELLLKAFAQAAGPDDSLVIIGEGGARAGLEKQAALLGLAGRVAFPGHGDVPPALAAADVFVLSSDYEALPAVVVEALASGLPVVATDCCVSMRKLVNGFGTIVPRRDVAALATAMRSQSALSPRQRLDAVAAMRTFTVERAAGLYEKSFITAKDQHGPENVILHS
jgi:glycosyltransferase involved in cell wall biosynthesis